MEFSGEPENGGLYTMLPDPCPKTTVGAPLPHLAQIAQLQHEKEACYIQNRQATRI